MVYYVCVAAVFFMKDTLILLIALQLSRQETILNSRTHTKITRLIKLLVETGILTGLCE
jgi:hypothetical protein